METIRGIINVVSLSETLYHSILVPPDMKNCKLGRKVSNQTNMFRKQKHLENRSEIIGCKGTPFFWDEGLDMGVGCYGKSFIIENLAL